jgi:hypothetical protein
VLVLAGRFGIVHESALQQQLAPLSFLQQECAFLPFLVFFLQQFIAPGSQQLSMLQHAALEEFEFCGVPKLIAAAEIARLPPQTSAITRAFILLIDTFSYKNSPARRRHWLVSLAAKAAECRVNLASTKWFWIEESRCGSSRRDEMFIET